MKCPIHGDDCPGDDGGFFMDGNHPDDMFGLGELKRLNKEGDDGLASVKETNSLTQEKQKENK